MDSHSVDPMFFWEAYHTSRVSSAVLLFICTPSFAILLRFRRRRIPYGAPEFYLQKGWIICSSAKCLPRSQPVLSKKIGLPLYRNDGRYNNPPDISLVLLGDSGVGKSTLVARCENRKPERTYDPTIEDTYHFTLKGGVTLEIKDTAGVDSYPSLRDKAIQEGNYFVLVFDVRNKGSFDYLKPIAANIRSQHGIKPPILFVGNRANGDGDREVTNMVAKTLAHRSHGFYMEVSDDQEDVGAVFSATLLQLQRTRPEQD
ncbi:GTP-binding protein RAB5 [Apiospora phragmitis]|uniref:GTP-binding protein RAB5 n=1 Tax=Apiospora phragmitis TaxID=2905665 RepID=A0ABR1SVP3_9PEZI